MNRKIAVLKWNSTYYDRMARLSFLEGLFSVPVGSFTKNIHNLPTIFRESSINKLWFWLSPDNQNF